VRPATATGTASSTSTVVSARSTSSCTVRRPGWRAQPAKSRPSYSRSILLVMAAAFTIQPRGPFALAHARAFLDSFGPAGQTTGDDPEALVLRFAPDDGEGVATVRLTQPERDGPVLGEGGHEEQAARILSLDVDASGWADLVARDAVLRDIGPVRPVLFGSPYEAAAWSVLSARVQIAQAVRLRARLSDGGAFPGPATLLAMDDLHVPPVKAGRLRAIAEAALAGDLDAARLRAMDPEDAMAAVQELPGIGPFYAALVLIRGAGVPDVLPMSEPRVRRAAADAYGDPALEAPDAFARHAERWRPWRSWAAFALRSGVRERS
jgi:DNA-3-methyladenine glycosylase II